MMTRKAIGRSWRWRLAQVAIILAGLAVGWLCGGAG